MSSTSTQIVNDREQAVAALQKSLDDYLATLASVPEYKGDAKLNNEGWSIIEVAEHVAAAEHGMFRSIEISTEKTTPTDFTLDQKIIAGGTNRETKRMAPERAHPKGRWKTLAECAEAFRQTRLRTIEFAKTAEGLRGKLVQHPLLGPVDAHQCMLIMAGHAQRHALQIEEIKNSAAYKNAAAH
jgi:hypothetical protein